MIVRGQHQAVSEITVIFTSVLIRNLIRAKEVMSSHLSTLNTAFLEMREVCVGNHIDDRFLM